MKPACDLRSSAGDSKALDLQHDRNHFLACGFFRVCTFRSVDGKPVNVPGEDWLLIAEVDCSLLTITRSAAQTAGVGAAEGSRRVFSVFQASLQWASAAADLPDLRIQLKAVPQSEPDKSTPLLVQISLSATFVPRF